MKQLIKKELLMNKEILVLVLIFPLFSHIVLRLYPNREFMYIMFSYFSVFLMGINIIANMRQQKNIKTEALFLSLPINREDFVKSLYISYGLLTLIFNIAFYLITFIVMLFPRFHLVSMGFDIIIISTSVTLIALAIMIPILYKWKKGYFLLTMAFVVLVIFLRDSLELSIRNKVIDINYVLLITSLLIVAMVSYVLSYDISKNSFNKRWVSDEKITKKRIHSK